MRVTPRMVRAVERMLTDAPNLREPTLFVLGQLALALRGHRELRLPPMLLVGPPAAGRTWWAEQLAHGGAGAAELARSDDSDALAR